MSSRCSACTCQNRCVPADGPFDAQVLLVGERPGWWEDEPFNRPFTGDSGRELNDNYLPLAGLDRDKIRFTNTVRCRTSTKVNKPSAAELQACAMHFLKPEIERLDPSVIVLMGGTPSSLVPSIKSMELEHGIPRWIDRCSYFGKWSGWVVPMYHPSAGMHMTSLMTPLLEDWKNLGDWMKGRWSPPTPVADVKVMKRLTTPAEVAEAMNRQDPRYEYLPTDTESDEGRPFSLQFSPNPEEGYMILREDQQAIDEFGSHLAFTWSNKMAMHFAVHDLDELERHYGFGNIETIDTMIEAYELGNLPQKLKYLAFRLTGVRMNSYDEVVTPASKEALENWLAEAIAFVSTDWKMQREVKKQPKTFAAKGLIKYESIKHPAEAVLRRVMRHNSNSESEYDPWQAPKKLGAPNEEVRLIGRDWLEPIESRIGRMPRPSIIHAPIKRAIEYGCSDAIYTGQCVIRLAERRIQQQKLWEVEI